MVHWLRICLPVQGTQVWPPGQGTKILHSTGQLLSLCATTRERPMCHNQGPTQPKINKQGEVPWSDSFLLFCKQNYNHPLPPWKFSPTEITVKSPCPIHTHTISSFPQFPRNWFVCLPTSLLSFSTPLEERWEWLSLTPKWRSSIYAGEWSGMFCQVQPNTKLKLNQGIILKLKEAKISFAEIPISSECFFLYKYKK